MLGLMPYVGTLFELSQREGGSGVFGRAREAFEDEVQAAGWVEEGSGDVVVPLRWRMLCVTRPLGGGS